MARLYAIESFHSVTGSNADHRFRVRASEVGDVVCFLLSESSSYMTGQVLHVDGGLWMNG